MARIEFAAEQPAGRAVKMRIDEAALARRIGRARFVQAALVDELEPVVAGFRQPLGQRAALVLERYEVGLLRFGGDLIADDRVGAFDIAFQIVGNAEFAEHLGHRRGGNLDLGGRRVVAPGNLRKDAAPGRIDVERNLLAGFVPERLLHDGEPAVGDLPGEGLGVASGTIRDWPPARRRGNPFER